MRRLFSSLKEEEGGRHWKKPNARLHTYPYILFFILFSLFETRSPISRVLCFALTHRCKGPRNYAGFLSNCLSPLSFSWYVDRKEGRREQKRASRSLCFYRKEKKRNDREQITSTHLRFNWNALCGALIHLYRRSSNVSGISAKPAIHCQPDHSALGFQTASHTSCRDRTLACASQQLGCRLDYLNTAAYRWYSVWKSSRDQRWKHGRIHRQTPVLSDAS